MNFFRGTFYGIVAIMLFSGSYLLAADRAARNAAKSYVCTKSQAEAGECLPAAQKAIVTPQGGIAFGESAAPTPAQAHRARMKWPEMSQKEVDAVTAALKARKEKAPQVAIVCKDSLCEDLALNLDNAFESARWKSEIVLATSFGVPNGVSTSSKWLADLVNGATGNRFGAKAEEAKSVDGPGEYILIGSKAR